VVALTELFVKLLPFYDIGIVSNKFRRMKSH